MRRIWRLIPASVIILLFLFSISGRGTEAPILINGDFELGDKTGWFGYGCRLEIVSDDVFRGNYACRAWLDQEWGGGHRARFNALNGRYRITMHVKISSGLAGKCWVGADKFGGAKISLPVKTAGEWTELSFEVRVRNGGCEIYTWGPKITGGWILLDEVWIENVEK